MPDQPKPTSDDLAPDAEPTEFEQPDLDDARAGDETPTGGTGILTSIAQA